MHKTVRCPPTSRIVRSWLALYCAMTLFRVSCKGSYMNNFRCYGHRCCRFMLRSAAVSQLSAMEVRHN